jgi:hypothetical protein
VASNPDTASVPAGSLPRKVWSAIGRKEVLAVVEAADGQELSAVTVGRKLRAELTAAVTAAQLPKSISGSRFIAAGLSETRGYLEHTDAHKVSNARAVSYLMRARTGALMMGHREAAAGLIPEKYRNECIACGAMVPDTLQHVVVHCAAYKDARKALLKPLWRRSHMVSAGAAQPSDKLRIALGSRCTEAEGQEPYWAGWLPVAEARLNGAGPDAEDDESPGFLLAGKFFAAVLPKHLSAVRSARRAAPAAVAAGDASASAALPASGGEIVPVTPSHTPGGEALNIHEPGSALNDATLVPSVLLATDGSPVSAAAANETNHGMAMGSAAGGLEDAASHGNESGVSPLVHAEGVDMHLGPDRATNPSALHSHLSTWSGAAPESTPPCGRTDP